MSRDFCELDALKAHIEDIDLIASRNGYRISLIEQHGTNVDNRFNLDEQRIAETEQRISNVEIHGSNVDKRFDNDEQSIENLYSSFRVMERRLNRIEKITGIALLKKLYHIFKR